jgi:hypothetical protein
MADSDDETPLNTPRVKRGQSSAVSEAETRPAVKAVKRRPVASSAGLLPESLASLSTIRCVEKNPVVKLLIVGGREHQYEFEGSELTASPASFFLRGWHYALRDGAGTLRFSVKRGLRWLLFNQMRVFDPDGLLIGRFSQRLSGLEVHFDVFDGEGNQRFALRQPAGEYRTFWAQSGGVDMGRIERDFVKWDGTLKQALAVRDAFKIELNPSLEELDRVLIIAASLLIDRLYFTDGKQ